jgi:magnesium chelatase subunit ChlI-like protein
MKPCSCKNSLNAQQPCTCVPAVITKYQKRISGPFPDRIDIHMEVPRVGFDNGWGRKRSCFQVMCLEIDIELRLINLPQTHLPLPAPDAARCRMVAPRSPPLARWDVYRVSRTTCWRAYPRARKTDRSGGCRLKYERLDQLTVDLLLCVR